MAKSRLQLNQRRLIALAISAAFPNAYAAPAAQVIFASGDVSATDPSGARRAVTKGAELNEGDLVATNEGRAQLRFIDGAQMSLPPRTDFRIEEYKFEGKTDGSERAVLNLLKGGMRTVTGSIGRTNQQTYQMKTRDAVMGIRGTEYAVNYGNSITMTVGEGAIEICNAAGCLTANAGETIYVADANTLPILIDKKTELPPPPFPATPITFRTGEDRGGDGGFAGLNIPPPPTQTTPETMLQPGFGTYNFAFAHNDNASGEGPPGSSHVIAPTLVRLDSELRANAFRDASGGEGHPSGTGRVTWPPPNTYETSPNPVAGFGNDGIIAWNRWVQGTTGGNGPHTGLQMPDGGEGGLHYVVGVPTPQSDLNLLSANPAMTAVAYDLIGATRPTTPGLFPGTFTGSLSVNFVAAQVTAALNVNILVTTYVVAATLPIVGPVFSTAFAGSNVTFVSGCSSGCSATIDGFFAGRNAARAGLAYSIVNQNNSTETAGAAAFRRQGF